MFWSRLFPVFIACVICGCSRTPPQPTQSVQELVGDRTCFEVVHDNSRPAEVDQSVRDLLIKPMTQNSAVQIALLNNPSLMVQLEEVGIAKADYIAASQIKNPAIYADFRLPDRRPPSGPDIEATAAEDVLDILLLPMRKRLAQQQLDQSAIRAADAALQMVHDSRVAFITLQAHQQQLELQKQFTAAAAARADFAHRQHDAGNINDLTLSIEDANFSQAQMQQLRADAQVQTDREKLNRLLGLNDGQLGWTMADGTLELPKNESTTQPDAEHRRLDIADAQKQVAIADQALAYTRNGILTEVNIGASMERETDHQTVIGPSIAFELPIFNQHQGQIARAEAELAQAKKKLDAVKNKAQSEIRDATLRLSLSRSVAELATNHLVQNRIAITRATQLQYNGMQVGLYELMAAKQEELIARREAVEVLMEYWVARAERDRAIGR